MTDSKDIYLRILDQIGDVFYRTDREGRLVMASTSAARLLGYNSVDEVLGLTTESFWYHPEERPAVAEALKETGEILAYPLVLRKRDGSPLHVESTAHYYYDDKGRVLGIEGVWHDISDRKRIEDILRESESKYRMVFEATGAPYGMIDLETGRIIDVNEAGCKQYGYTREELLQLTFRDISAEPENSSEGFKNGVTYVPLRYHKRKNGEIFPVEGYLSYCKWDGRDVVIVSLRDITQRIASEEALRESEARYKGIVESQRDIILRFDASFHACFASDSWYRVTGVHIDEPGLNIQRDFIHPQDLSTLLEHNRKLLHPPYRDYVECRIRTLRGWRWYGLESYMMRDSNGIPVEGQAVGRDISDHKFAEEQLKTHARRLSMATEAASEAIWEYNIVTGELYVGPQAYGMLEYPPDTDIDYVNAMHRDDYCAFEQHVKEHLSGVIDKIDQDFRVTTKSGRQLWIHSRGRITQRDADGQALAVGGTVTDVTEAHNARKALENAHADLQTAYRAQKEFLDCITHEVRTPLITVKGYADMLMEGFAGPLTEQQRDCLRKIQTGSDSLLSGLTTMLEMSRIKGGKTHVNYEIFCPAKLVSKVLTEVAPHAHQKGLSIKLHDCGCRCSGVTDATKVTLILTNILSNAIKFTDQGGIEVFVESCDSGFSVAVLDTGKGMPEEEVETIFEEFMQLKTCAKYKETGFGIGLALVSALIDILGAELTVSTMKCTGSAFTIYVPKLDPSAAELSCDPMP